MITRDDSIPLAKDNRSRDPLSHALSTFGGKQLVFAFGSLLLAAVVTLLPTRVDAQCTQWDVSGEWEMLQGATRIYLTLNQRGSRVTGTARYEALSGTGTFKAAETAHGQVTGRMDGDKFNGEIHWSNNNTTGVYTGFITANSYLTGRTYDKANRSSNANWSSNTAMKCKDTASVPAGVPTATPRPAVSNPTPAAEPAFTPIKKLKIRDAPAKTAPGGLAAWIGHWDTTTAQGGHFELVLQQEGESLVGLFQDLNGNPQYNGSLRGTVSGNVFTYECFQRGTGTTSRGSFEIDAKGEVIDGSGVVSDAAKTKFRWRGTKVK